MVCAGTSHQLICIGMGGPGVRPLACTLSLQCVLRHSTAVTTPVGDGLAETEWPPINWRQLLASAA